MRRKILKKQAIFIVLSLILFVVLSLDMTKSFAQVPTDVENHWAKIYIERIVEMGAISGYPDGTFRADNKITNAEFVKILVSLESSDIREAKPSEHWSQRYFDKALKLGIIKVDEKEALFPEREYDKYITRGHIALLISRVVKEKYNDIDDYKNQVRDLYYNTNGKEYLREPIALVFRAGIVGGYPDKKFLPDNGATRAEAVTMLMRYVDSSLRLKVEKNVSMLSIQEFTPEQIADGYYDFVIDFHFRHPAEPQYEHARKYMASKGVSQDLIEKIMQFVDKKKGHRNMDFTEILKWGEKGDIRIEAPYRSNYVTIYFDREVTESKLVPVFD